MASACMSVSWIDTKGDCCVLTCVDVSQNLECNGIRDMPKFHIHYLPDVVSVASCLSRKHMDAEGFVIV